MKLKDLKGFPKEKGKWVGVTLKVEGKIDGYNDARSQIGEIEVEIDEGKLYEWLEENVLKYIKVDATGGYSCIVGTDKLANSIKKAKLLRVKK